MIHRRGPVEAVVADGRLRGLKARKVTRVFDEAGRFAPEYDDADRIDLECDTVILAIGQAADTGFAAGSDLAVDGRDRLAFNPSTHQTNVPFIFACGEIVTAPGSAVEACAHGQRAAKAVHLYLTGQPIEIDDDLPPFIETIPAATAEKVKKVPRCAVPTEPPDKRRDTFEEVDHNYDEAAAMWEARRCMGCGGGAEVLVDKCVACLTCLRICPFDVPVVTDVARIDSALCQACGMCIAECPGNAIIARSRDVHALVAQTAETLGQQRAGRKIVAYICGHHSPAAAWTGALEDGLAGIEEIYLPSMSRLSAAEILHAFENGADGVLVVACRAGADRYPHATERIRKRVGQVRDLLGEIGMGDGCVQLIEAADLGRSAIRSAMAEAADKIVAL